MKTKIRTMIAISVLGMIGFTNISAIADNKKAVNAEFASESDEMLTIESWMTDENYWTLKAQDNAMEAEETLQIESWMTNENYWTSETEVIAIEADEPLTVESWMTDESLWK